MKTNLKARNNFFAARRNITALRKKVLLILRLNNICSFFFTIIYYTSPSSFFTKPKFFTTKNHVLASGLQSFLLNTSYKVHVMSNPIKDKIQLCGGNRKIKVVSKKRRQKQADYFENNRFSTVLN